MNFPNINREEGPRRWAEFAFVSVLVDCTSVMDDVVPGI